MALQSSENSFGEDLNVHLFFFPPQMINKSRGFSSLPLALQAGNVISNRMLKGAVRFRQDLTRRVWLTSFPTYLYVHMPRWL